MSRTVCAAAFATAAFVATPVLASASNPSTSSGSPRATSRGDDQSAATPLASATVLATAVAAAAAVVDAITPTENGSVVTEQKKSSDRRPSALVPLYGSYVALQGYDFYSTRKGLSRDAVESNPVMKGVVGKPAAFIAVKGATTFASIYFAERLWRSNRRVAAVALMAASNGLMAVVAANNASVLNRQCR